MNDKIIFRPEILLEYTLSATESKSKLSIQSTKDAILILEGIKPLTTDHLVIIYLGENDVVVGIDTFVCGLDGFNAAQTTRALSSILQHQNRCSTLKVVIAQTVYNVKTPMLEDIDIQGLTNFAIRVMTFDIELVDCILIGQEGYFSFKSNEKIWAEYTQKVETIKEFILKEPFIPYLLKQEKE